MQAAPQSPSQSIGFGGATEVRKGCLLRGGCREATGLLGRIIRHPVPIPSFTFIFAHGQRLMPEPAAEEPSWEVTGAFHLCLNLVLVVSNHFW